MVTRRCTGLGTLGGRRLLKAATFLQEGGGDRGAQRGGCSKWIPEEANGDGCEPTRRSRTAPLRIPLPSAGIPLESALPSAIPLSRLPCHPSPSFPLCTRRPPFSLHFSRHRPLSPFRPSLAAHHQLLAPSPPVHLPLLLSSSGCPSASSFVHMQTTRLLPSSLPGPSQPLTQPSSLLQLSTPLLPLHNPPAPLCHPSNASVLIFCSQKLRVDLDAIEPSTHCPICLGDNPPSSRLPAPFAPLPLLPFVALLSASPVPLLHSNAIHRFSNPIQSILSSGFAINSSTPSRRGLDEAHGLRSSLAPALSTTNPRDSADRQRRVVTRGDQELPDRQGLPAPLLCRLHRAGPSPRQARVPVLPGLHPKPENPLPGAHPPPSPARRAASRLPVSPAQGPPWRFGLSIAVSLLFDEEPKLRNTLFFLAPLVKCNKTGWRCAGTCRSLPPCVPPPSLLFPYGLSVFPVWSSSRPSPSPTPLPACRNLPGRSPHSNTPALYLPS